MMGWALVIILFIGLFYFIFTAWQVASVFRVLHIDPLQIYGLDRVDREELIRRRFAEEESLLERRLLRFVKEKSGPEASQDLEKILSDRNGKWDMNFNGLKFDSGMESVHFPFFDLPRPLAKDFLDLLKAKPFAEKLYRT